MSASLTIPPPTNLSHYVRYLEAANEYHSHQLERARAEIHGLRADLARARGHLVIGAAS